MSLLDLNSVTDSISTLSMWYSSDISSREQENLMTSNLDILQNFQEWKFKLYFMRDANFEDLLVGVDNQYRHFPEGGPGLTKSAFLYSTYFWICILCGSNKLPLLYLMRYDNLPS